MSIVVQWAQLDGCVVKPAVNKSGITETYTWEACRERTVVVLVAVKGVGHTWFNPPGQPDATKVVWDFFIQASERA